MARLSKDDYLRAGLEILGETGSDGLTISALCERLSVTKGSFYHHFSGMPAFHTAVLAYWEREHNDRLITASDTGSDTVWQIPVLTEIAANLPHATEAAIRAWGKSNHEVAECQARVDASREGRIFEVLASLGLDQRKAELLTNMAVSILIGFQHRPPLEAARLQAMLAETNRLIFLELSD